MSREVSALDLDLWVCVAVRVLLLELETAGKKLVGDGEDASSTSETLPISRE